LNLQDNQIVKITNEKEKEVLDHVNLWRNIMLLLYGILVMFCKEIENIKLILFLQQNDDLLLVS
jgi:hypothetical protein